MAIKHHEAPRFPPTGISVAPGRSWPKEVQDLVGKTEHWKSLCTSDLKTARSRSTQAHWEFEKQLIERKRRSAPSEHGIRRVVRQFYDRELVIDHCSHLSGNDYMGYREVFSPHLLEVLKESVGRGAITPVVDHFLLPPSLPHAGFPES